MQCEDPFLNSYAASTSRLHVQLLSPVSSKLHSTGTVSACSWYRKAYAWHGLSLLARRDLAYNPSENDVDVMAHAMSAVG
jgi:hypothetical protein